MKTILAVALLGAGIAAAAQQTINVTGDAEVKVVPDRVLISLGVEVRAKSLVEARRENDRRVRAVLDTAKRGGIQPKDIQTDFVQLGIQYQADGLTPQYYYARKSIELVLYDLNRMESILGSAVDAGAT
ncbi:MAG TPA: SIMPL domain-containing protein, partial [Mycobacterium sp.]|nr:SIMPL domain-containing protein [Mycobacterium sp.]